jgi:hypothetical protein
MFFEPAGRRVQKTSIRNIYLLRRSRRNNYAE